MCAKLRIVIEDLDNIIVGCRCEEDKNKASPLHDTKAEILTERIMVFIVRQLIDNGVLDIKGCSIRGIIKCQEN